MVAWVASIDFSNRCQLRRSKLGIPYRWPSPGSMRSGNSSSSTVISIAMSVPIELMCVIQNCPWPKSWRSVWNARGRRPQGGSALLPAPHENSASEWWYPLLSSNMARWKIIELNSGFHIAVFDYQSVNGCSSNSSPIPMLPHGERVTHDLLGGCANRNEDCIWSNDEGKFGIWGQVGYQHQSSKGSFATSVQFL